MKKLVSILNFLSVLGIIYLNYLVSQGWINDSKMGEISNSIDSLFTPASYAFSIWGIIYLGLTINAIWLIIATFKHKYSETIKQQGLWVALANLFSGLWLWFWLNQEILISVFWMLCILVSLMIAIVRLKMEKWDAPAKIIAFVWWPICLYSGWITVATITNIAAYLKTVEFNFFFSESTWTIIMIIVATIVFIYFLLTRYMREYNAVAIWAFVAIAIKQWEQHIEISYTAIIACLIIGSLSFYQGFKYRKSNPFFPRFLK